MTDETEHDLTTPEGLAKWQEGELASLARTATRAREAADRLIDEGRPRDAQSAATVAGIALTKIKEAAGQRAPKARADNLEQLERDVVDYLGYLRDKYGTRAQAPEHEAAVNDA